MKLDVKAFAIAVAVIWAGAVLLVGLAGLLWPGYGGAFLNVVASVYPGYESDGSLGQTIIATLYATVDGAIGGAVFAWIYNFFARY